MSFGAALFTETGSELFAVGGVGITLVDVINAPANTSGSKSYPQLPPGMELLASPVLASPALIGVSDYHLISVSYPGGVPTVSWGLSGVYGRAATTLYVYGR